MKAEHILELEKIETEQALNKRAIAVNRCPKCMGNLTEKGNGHGLDTVCVPCNILWDETY